MRVEWRLVPLFAAHFGVWMSEFLRTMITTMFVAFFYALWCGAVLCKAAAAVRMSRNGLSNRYPTIWATLIFSALRSATLAYLFRFDPRRYDACLRSERAVSAVARGRRHRGSVRCADRALPEFSEARGRSRTISRRRWQPWASGKCRNAPLYDSALRTLGRRRGYRAGAWVWQIRSDLVAGNLNGASYGEFFNAQNSDQAATCSSGVMNGTTAMAFLGVEHFDETAQTWSMYGVSTNTGKWIGSSQEGMALTTARKWFEVPLARIQRPTSRIPLPLAR